MFVKGTVPSCQWKGAHAGRKPDIWECHFSQPRTATCPGCCRCGGTTLSPWLPLWADTAPNCHRCMWLKQKTERGSSRWASSSWPCRSQCWPLQHLGVLPASSLASLPGSASQLLILRDTERKHQEDVPLDDVGAGMICGVIIEAKRPALNTVPPVRGTTDRHLQTPTQPPEWVQQAAGRHELVS